MTVITRVGSRLWSLQLLRAVAILLVVCHHSIIGFWSSKNEFYTPAFSSLVGNTIEKIISFERISNIYLGLVGVSIFFLISGFLIPITIMKYRPLPFLIARIFRIFPVYLFSLGIIVLLSQIYFHATHIPYAYCDKPFAVYANIIFLMDPKFRFIDPVIWTLRVEVLFYLLMAFVNTVSDTSKFSTVLLTSTIICLCCTTVRFFNSDTSFFVFFLKQIVGLSIYLIYMFIGTVIYNYWSTKSNERSLTNLIIQVATLFALYSISFQGLDIKTMLTNSYGVGLIVFCIVFFFRQRFKENKLLNWVGEISYPIYLIHNVSGGILATLIYRVLPNIYLALICSLIAIFAISDLLHSFLERPFNNFGKLLAQSLSNRKQYKRSLDRERTGQPAI